MSDLYQEIIIEEYRHPHNKGEMIDADVQHRERNSSCGDEVTVFLKFDAEERISEVLWSGDGCAISISGMSLLSEFVKHKTTSEVLGLKKSDVEELLGIEEIAYGREKCLVLGLTAVQHAIKKHTS